MRKSKRQPEQPPYVLVRDVLPDTVEFLRRLLQKTTLAEQVRDLRIYGRCPCGGPDCGTFYCVPPNDYERLAKRHGTDGKLDPVIVSNGKIIAVETLDPKVDAVLDQLFPDTPGVATRRIRPWLSDSLLHFERNAPAIEAEIELAERVIGVQFPLAYQEFLLIANGGEGPIGQNSYAMLWKVEELFHSTGNIRCRSMRLGCCSSARMAVVRHSPSQRPTQWFACRLLG